MRITKTRLMGGLTPLIRALAVRAGATPVVENVHSKPWASATFNGAHHQFSLRFGGNEAARHASALCGGLNYAEFDLETYILVDIAILDVFSDAKGKTLILEALMIDND